LPPQQQDSSLFSFFLNNDMSLPPILLFREPLYSFVRDVNKYQHHRQKPAEQHSRYHAQCHPYRQIPPKKSYIFL